MRMEDLPKYVEPDWDKILASVDWTEFDYKSRRFRVGQYPFENSMFTSVELFVNDGAPTADGWVGIRWAQSHGLNNDWPGVDVISKYIKKQDTSVVEDTQEGAVRVDPQTGRIIDPYPKTSLKVDPQTGRIIRPRI